MINHNPICSCPVGYIGDPFIRCYLAPKQDTPEPPINPCNPSPCGLYAECRPVGNNPSCSCLPNYFGSPPNCRPECVVNTDCPSDKACIAEKCRNPCEGSCGFNSGTNITYSEFGRLENTKILLNFILYRMPSSKSYSDLYMSSTIYW